MASADCPQCVNREQIKEYRKKSIKVMGKKIFSYIDININKNPNFFLNP